MIINHFDIDGLDVRDNVNFMLTPLGLFAGDRDIITNDLYSDGESYNRGKTKARKIVLTGVILGDILSNINILKKVLYKSGLKKFTVGVVGMPTFYFYADMSNWGCDDNCPQFISCQCVAPDPYLHGVDLSTVSLGAIANGSVAFPLTFPFSFGAITGGEGIVTNSGTALSYPVITIIGVCNNIAVTNLTTGETMSCAVSLGATDTLVIDSRPKTRGVYLNNAPRIDLKVGNWFSCPAGINDFNFTRNSLEVKQHCSIALESWWY